MLCRDGLHLNDRGADEMGRRIYNHRFCSAAIKDGAKELGMGNRTSERKGSRVSKAIIATLKHFLE